jgi:2-hydroxy-3-keto-5-methylthiopentenyl-1-phosphate phosphatase
LRAGRITLREALAREAALVRLSHPETLAVLESRACIDPTFAPFVRRAHHHGAKLAVVSAGIRQVIGPALERAGVEVPVYANDVEFHPDGWRMTFFDDSPLGHDKASHVEDARAAGLHTVYVGDGISDFEAAHAADVVFAKKDRALEAYCRERGIACTPFTSFDDVGGSLFPAG